MSKPTAAQTRVQNVPGVDDSYIADRFIGGESVDELAADYGTDRLNIEGAIRTWADPYWHLDFAASQLFDRWTP